MTTPAEKATDLKPCPFCGSSAYRDVVAFGQFDNICCKNSVCPLGDVPFDDVQWNTRAHESPPVTAQGQQGWMPIETAPKDDEILALIRGDSGAFRRVVLAFDDFHEEWRFDGAEISYAWRIIGWQPLPPAPKKENDDE